MVTMGTLSWLLDADSTKFQKGVRSARKQIAGLTVVVTAASAALAAWVNNSINYGDRLAKTARITGVTVEELQVLRFTMERSGGSALTMDGALKVLSKRLGELKQGTGSLATFLRKYDAALLTALQSTNSTREALGLIAEAMKNATSEADRNALASAAFSRGMGFDMVLALAKGEAGLQNFGEEARRINSLLTDDMAKAQEEARDSIDNLVSTLGSMATVFTARLSPAVTEYADALRIKIPAAVKAALVTLYSLYDLAALTGALLLSVATIDLDRLKFLKEEGHIRSLGEIRQDAMDEVDRLFNQNQGPRESTAGDMPGGDSQAQTTTAEESKKQTALLQRQQELTVELIDGIRTITNIGARAG